MGELVFEFQPLKYFTTDVRDYLAVPGGVVDASPGFQAAINAVIAVGGGTVTFGPGSWLLETGLDFSALGGTQIGVTFQGAGSGSVNGASGGASILLNHSGGSAIKALGTTVGAKNISGLRFKDFVVKNTVTIGSAYTIDTDYCADQLRMENLFVWGQNLGGNGIRITNPSRGQGGTMDVRVEGFRTGTGIYVGAVVTAGVAAARNSGNLALIATSASDCLTGIELDGTGTLLNSIDLVACKVLGRDGATIPGSVGLYLHGSVETNTATAFHSEAMETGIWFGPGAANNTIEGATVTHATALGTPDANSAAVRFTGSAHGNRVLGIRYGGHHYGVSSEGTGANEFDGRVCGTAVLTADVIRSGAGPLISTIYTDTGAARGESGWATVRQSPLRPSGAIMESYDRSSCAEVASLTAPVSGTLMLLLCPFSAGDLVTTLDWHSGATALGSGTHQWAALYSTALAKLAVSDDDGATAWGTNTKKTFTLSTPYRIPTTGNYYVGLCVVASTVMSFTGKSGASLTGSLEPALFGSSTTALTDPASAPDTAHVLTAIQGNRPYVVAR